MNILNYLTLSRSNFSDENRKIFAIEFKDNFEGLFDVLNSKFKSLMPLQSDIKKEYGNLIKNEISMLTINDEFYPKLLKTIDTVPILITFKGDKNIFNRQKIAVVGSRKLEKNDIFFIKSVIDFIKNLNFVVVSGLANGSDIISHVQSIKTGTIAVMPCGLRYCYPKENKIIEDKIVENGGAIISEYSFNEPPKHYNFIQRNRIIVGLSNSVVITRAREIKSGTMSNVKFAKEFTREIYTFNLNDNFSNGNNFLLKKRIANEIDNFEDLKFSFIKDIAKNEIYIDKYINNFNKTFNNNLFECERKSIQNEINLISKNAKIKFEEKNIHKLYQICKEQLQTDGKTILLEMLKMIK